MGTKFKDSCKVSTKGAFSSGLHGFVKILFRFPFAQEKTFVEQLARAVVRGIIKEASRDKWATTGTKCMTSLTESSEELAQR